jgi:hypothetical protein
MHEYFLLERHSAYQIVIHCCGMLEWWTRAAILGLEVKRDRDAEFVATGTVAQLTARADDVRTRFLADLADIDPSAALKGDPAPNYRETPIGESAGGVLMHVFEELAQHHGHLDLTRDLVLAARRGQ